MGQSSSSGSRGTPYFGQIGEESTESTRWTAPDPLFAVHRVHQSTSPPRSPPSTGVHRVHQESTGWTVDSPPLRAGDGGLALTRGSRSNAWLGSLPR